MRAKYLYIVILFMFNILLLSCDERDNSSDSSTTTGGDSEISVEEYFSYNVSNHQYSHEKF